MYCQVVGSHWYHAGMIAVDTESSGLDPNKASILSIGAVDTEDPAQQFYDECRMWEGAEVSDEALAVNGFTREEISDPSKKTEAELITDFMAWAMDRVGNHTLVAQNVAFDSAFIRAAARRAGIESSFAQRSIDTHTVAWMHMTMRGLTPPEVNHRSALNLDAVLQYCGIPAEPKPHNALTGASCHAEVFSRMAYNKKILPDFASYEIPWKNT
jgi:DNA polymerase III epsilon subunit-like protein